MPKISRTQLSIVMIVVIFSSMLGVTGYFYWDLYKRHNKLQLEYNLLESSYTTLKSDYRGLNETHQILVTKHTILESDFEDLSSEYNSLKAEYETLNVEHLSLLDDYDELSAKYLSLFGDHEALLKAFNEPLSYEETPSASELQDWLAVDQTNEIPYSSPDFVCGDFAVMLSQHAKMKHWDMGVVGVFGYFRDTREPYGHAFNAIFCVEGLYYVEPQTDDIWCYEGYREIEQGDYWEIGGEWIYVEDYDIIVLYD